MTSPPADPRDPTPRRLIVLLIVLAVLLILGCGGGIVFFVAVCLG